MANQMGAAMNPMFWGPDDYRQQYQLQRQQELAQALQQQGMTPIDTNNRSSGRFVTHVSPLEPLAKMLQAYAGLKMGDKAASGRGELQAKQWDAAKKMADSDLGVQNDQPSMSPEQSQAMAQALSGQQPQQSPTPIRPPMPQQAQPMQQQGPQPQQQAPQQGFVPSAGLRQAYAMKLMQGDGAGAQKLLQEAKAAWIGSQKETYHTLTADEAKAAGYPEGAVVAVNALGKPEVVDAHQSSEVQAFHLAKQDNPNLTYAGFVQLPEQIKYGYQLKLAQYNQGQANYRADKDNSRSENGYHPPISTDQGYMAWDNKTHTYKPLVQNGKPLMQPAYSAPLVGDVSQSRAAGTAAGTATGTAQGQLAATQASLPQLENTAKTLSDLGHQATYTLAGQARDAIARQVGKATPGAIAREKYLTTVKDVLFPQLRATFGAQFTVKEGEALLSTLGDINKTPQEKDAALESFIDQKKQLIGSLQRQTGASQNSATSQSPGQRMTPEQASMLPSGTSFVGMDGVTRVKH